MHIPTEMNHRELEVLVRYNSLIQQVADKRAMSTLEIARSLSKHLDQRAVKFLLFVENGGKLDAE